MKRVAFLLLLTAAFFFTALQAQKTETPMSHHARGSFTVDMKPLTPPPAEGLSRFSIDKKLTGDLDGTTQGEMFSGGDPKQGEAGYVAIEVFTGTLAGKHGTFALQHTATMNRGVPQLSVTVVPDSGTGDLTGITGSMNIIIEAGKHSYEFAYSL